MTTQAEIDEARRARLLAGADRAQAESDARSAAAQQVRDTIPFGQPILVGHHSERRHRRDLARMNDNDRRSVEAWEHAQELERRAGAVGHAISADASDALDLLRAKLAAEVARRDEMKAVNATLRRTSKAGPDAQVAALVAEHGWNEGPATRLVCPSFGRPGYTWHLTNLSANIRRIEQRIAALEAAAARPELDGGERDGITWGEDRDANRVWIEYPGKPDADTRARLKSAGFRWAPSLGRWQRQTSPTALHHARTIVEATT